MLLAAASKLLSVKMFAFLLTGGAVRNHYLSASLRRCMFLPRLLGGMDYIAGWTHHIHCDLYDLVVMVMKMIT